MCKISLRWACPTTTTRPNFCIVYDCWRENAQIILVCPQNREKKFAWAWLSLFHFLSCFQIKKSWWYIVKQKVKEIWTQYQCFSLLHFILHGSITSSHHHRHDHGHLVLVLYHHYMQYFHNKLPYRFIRRRHQTQHVI